MLGDDLPPDQGVRDTGCAGLDRTFPTSRRAETSTEQNAAPRLVTQRATPRRLRNIMGILWTILIGFVAGVIAKFIMPGPNEPSGFILTTILGIVGAFVASYLGQALGWYAPGEGAGLIGAVVGAVIVLFVWGLIARRRA
jgi:uncharacterized membrane protein YeaQ/YmgE (transglycosylase-associated protein family)